MNARRERTMMNRLQTTVRHRVVQALTMALIAVAIASNSGLAEPVATSLPVSLAPADESGLSVIPSPGQRTLDNPVLPKGNGLNPCSSPRDSSFALHANNHHQQSCYQSCVNRCWLRWMSRGHTGDRLNRYQLFLKCKNSCMWSCG